MNGWVKRNGVRPRISMVVRIGSRLMTGISTRRDASTTVRMIGVYGEAWFRWGM